MKTVFADAGYWIAILNPADDLRAKAASLSNSLEPFQIVTSEMVFTEVLNSFSKRESAFRQAAAQFVKQSFDNLKIEVVPQTSDLFRQSLDLYEQRADKAWSHTDCASFCIMQQRNILEALTHDRHFEQAGFIALLRQGKHRPPIPTIRPLISAFRPLISKLHLLNLALRPQSLKLRLPNSKPRRGC